MPVIELHLAQPSDYPSIENMMQFYSYDFSEWLPLSPALSLGQNGLSTIRPKATYWARPTTQGFIIKVDGEVAGFVTVDDEVNYPELDHNMGYFFVARRFRGKGVAKQALGLLLPRFVGRWQIFHIDDNRPAALFWKKFIADYTQDAFSVHQEWIDEMHCTLYQFEQTTN